MGRSGHVRETIMASRQTWILVGVLVLGALALVAVAVVPLPQENVPRVSGQSPRDASLRRRTTKVDWSQVPIDRQRVYGYLKQICALGPRPSGSPGMQRQIALLQAHFQNLGAQVQQQSFVVRHPLDGTPVRMTNLLIRWHPERSSRVLLCAHYDTRPYPDRDPVDPRGTFLGANDGASGVAVLMELGHHLGKLKLRHGVDFVLFDGEEFVFRETDRYFLGSEHFARHYAQSRRKYRYRWGVLLDMVGDADLAIYQEANSMRTAATRRLTRSIWNTARRLGVREFVPRIGYEVRDDHLPLNEIARIPTCDVIDFHYPYWHTRQDVPEKCSPESLAKVAWVMLEWLKRLR